MLKESASGRMRRDAILRKKKQRRKLRLRQKRTPAFSVTMTVVSAGVAVIKTSAPALRHVGRSPQTVAAGAGADGDRVVEDAVAAAVAEGVAADAVAVGAAAAAVAVDAAAVAVVAAVAAAAADEAVGEKDARTVVDVVVKPRCYPIVTDFWRVL
ncbi:uncharacterized protein LOC125049704 isoform X1 [Pieris napi]|uniref:uncharacterized protein LOC125049704 isoform X1 n=1 Tax=Pieris napi TaxID=78633 RepID=UPI001FB9B339|nr:uncharacterized protein LOC125049704 isoform X1 [Pieris napi]